MNENLSELRNNLNTIDYPEEVFNYNKWNKKYLKELYDRSINGARSERSLSHLEKVEKKIHRNKCIRLCSIASISMLMVLIAYLLYLKK